MSLALVVLSATVHAGDIRDDRPDASYTTYGNLPQFNGIATVDFFEPSAATLISGNWLLSAGHLALSNQVTFGFGTPNARTYNVIQNIPNPNWVDAAHGYDFRLLQIDGNPIADGVATTIFPLYRGPILDKVITNVGYGDTGNGVTGFTLGSFGTRRGGNMVIRGFFTEVTATEPNNFLTRSATTTIMTADFINPDVANQKNVSTILTALNGTTTYVAPQDLEYMIAGRDSGSPALINDNGVWKIAGVSSFIATLDDSPNFGKYGELSGFSYITDDVYNWIVTTASIPEPSTIAFLGLAACGGAGFAWHRYRRRKNALDHIVSDEFNA